MDIRVLIFVILLRLVSAQFKPGICVGYDEAPPLVRDGNHKLFKMKKGTLVSYLGDIRRFPAASVSALDSSFQKGFKVVSTRICGVSDIGGVLVEVENADTVIDVSSSFIYEYNSIFLSEKEYKKTRVYGSNTFNYPSLRLSGFSDLGRLLRKNKNKVVLVEMLPTIENELNLRMRILLSRTVNFFVKYIDSINMWENVALYSSSNFPILIAKDLMECSSLYGRLYSSEPLNSSGDNQKLYANLDGDYSTYQPCTEMNDFIQSGFEHYYEFTYSNGDLNRLACVGFLAFNYQMFDKQMDAKIVQFPGKLSDIVKASTYNTTTSSHHLKVISTVDIEDFFINEKDRISQLKLQIKHHDIDFIMAPFNEDKL